MILKKAGKSPKEKSIFVVSVRDVDPGTYRRFKAYSALLGKTIGRALTELMSERLREVDAAGFEAKVEAIRGR